ncbi:MAG: hypothetical protein M1840_006999 [Geoglossum simile]|nr:MAG: hypothetical protein M1840_006999 [Geoglossum simile]
MGLQNPTTQEKEAAPFQEKTSLRREEEDSEDDLQPETAVDSNEDTANRHLLLHL